MAHPQKPMNHSKPNVTTQPWVKQSLVVALALIVTACASVTKHGQDPGFSAKPDPQPPYYLRRNIDDPFSAIEAATRRLTFMAQAVDPSEEPGQDLWQRTIDRFEFAQCEDFPEASSWAQWFGERPDYIERVMERARPWLFDIVTELENRNLPGELALLPIVESAYDPFAYSHGRASGAWQFLAPTAESHGIKINDWYDGRRDVYAATRAALTYLEQLNTRFDGDWNLALAAYNGGQGRVGRAIERNRRLNHPTDWRSLRLPQETKAYIPKLHGLSCLFASPAEYGLMLPKWPNQPVVERIELNGPTDVVVFSALLGLDVAELMALNPGLNRHITSPTGPHHLIVPIPLADQARSLVEDMANAQWLEYRSITVVSGDTLSGLASKHDTSVDALMTHNKLNTDRIQIGQRLEIPSKISPKQPSQFADRYQELAVLQSRLVPAKRFQHEVRPGESLWVIARRYGVEPSDLQRWNQLGSSNLIRPGQRLTVIMEPTRASQVVTPTAKTRYIVRNGDSLWAIARRHRIPLDALIEENNLQPNSILRPGQALMLSIGGSSE